MPYNERVKFRDNRTGRFRRAQPYERNRHFQVDTLSSGLANFQFKTANGMADIAQEFAGELVDYARKNAPWNDRTGDARDGLETEVRLENDSLEIDLYHTISYGIWLEIRWGGRYAIIIPTVEQKGSELLDRMNNMLSEIIYYD